MILEVYINKHTDDGNYKVGSDLTVRLQLEGEAADYAGRDMSDVAMVHMNEMGFSLHTWHGWGVGVIDQGYHEDDAILVVD